MAKHKHANESCGWGDCPHERPVEEEDFENGTAEVIEVEPGVFRPFHYDCAEEYYKNLEYLRGDA